jgi:hypothetical protein
MDRINRLWQVVLNIPAIVLLGILFAAIMPFVLAVFLADWLFIHIAIWSIYCTRGTHVLFVHSNSPNWQDYVQKHLLPELPEASLILNWSERSTWNRRSLSVQVFRHFGGDREFNPMAVVFRPFRRTRTFRFWQAFRDYKHGKDRELKKVEADFLAALASLEKRT